MLYVPCCEIKIGGKSFRSLNEVKIKRSIHKVGATATIKVPVTSVLHRAGQPPARIETAQAFEVGDPVEIRLGYNGALRLEFRGYVKLKNLQTPLEIECEDEFYQTRNRNITITGKTTLSDVLSKCGVSVAHATSLTIDDFPVDNRPASWVLGKLQTDYGLAIWFDMEGKLYASEPYKVQDDTVKYRLRWNTISDDDLKFHRADDVKLRIKAICIYRDGTKIEATIGAKDGTEKTLYFYDVKDKNELAALADAELKRYSYDGYSGKIEAFLQPYAQPCMLADIESLEYPEKNGRYFIESTEIEYGTSGARRTVEIGIKI